MDDETIMDILCHAAIGFLNNDPEVPTIIWKQFLGSPVLEIRFQVPTILDKLISRGQYFYEIITGCSFPSNLVLELLEIAE